MIPILGPWFQWVLIHAENHTIYSKITSHAHALSCIYIYVHNCIIIYPDIAPYIPIYSIYVHLSLYVQIHWTGCSYSICFGVACGSLLISTLLRSHWMEAGFRSLAWETRLLVSLTLGMEKGPTFVRVAPEIHGGDWRSGDYPLVN